MTSMQPNMSDSSISKEPVKRVQPMRIKYVKKCLSKANILEKAEEKAKTKPPIVKRLRTAKSPKNHSGS